MDLPHELLDEILSYLSLDNAQDQQSLQNCSLVAKSWTNPCRRRLFRMVDISPAVLRSWLDSIPPANDELLQHIRSLSYVTAASGCRLLGKYRIDVLQDYLPSFHQLRYLSLSSMHILSDISEQVEIFSAFRYTLSRLSVEFCHVTTNALVTLLNYFSRLNCLNLFYLLHQVDDKPAPPLSRPPIRELHISELYFHSDGHDIFDQLSELGLLFDEVIVDE